MSELIASPWIQLDHCAFRYLLPANPNDVHNTDVPNRIAFIEKIPRVRVKPYDGDGSCIEHYTNWHYGPKGCGEECGQYRPSREWCDAELRKRGYLLT